MYEERGTPERPVWMAVMMPDVPLRRVVLNLAITIIPVGVAILMQKPALRQAMVMRGSFYAWQAAEWVNCRTADISLKLATAYNRAKL